MTEAPSQVSPERLAASASRCQALAAGFAVAPPAGVASNWQSSAAAVNRADRRAGKAITGSAARMRATATKLTAAAAGYEAHETEAVHRFSQLPPRGPVLA
ncbi:hypothetical protein [Mycolicibacter sinensis]|uniref:hypothetical protein n=1 Tax=Mycolicibacter sinensis (strain JDM601) TaxID=875328 RepID=UPI001042146C|nr:hypothetical protein [Mycolicibacter sinensis]